jgi:hypothetical protein
LKTTFAFARIILFDKLEFGEAILWNGLTFSA